MALSRALAIVGSGLAAVVGTGCKDSVTPSAPITVTAVSPARDLLGGGSSVTVTGTNFINVISVTIGGSELGNRTVVSATQITGVTPAVTSPGAKDVVVTTSSHGSATCSGCFTYLSNPPILATALAAGGAHACGLSSAGATYCWGDNFYGQLGDGTATSSSIPVAVAGGLSFSALAAGRYHTCGLTNAGSAYCWGGNYVGQLGDGSTTPSSVPVAVAGGLNFSAIAAGGVHTCGLISGGAAYCWGDDEVGQLGEVGDELPVIRTTPIAVSGGLRFSALAPGGIHTCGLIGGSAAYCWGGNYVGQLGDGSTTNSSTPVPVAGGLNFSALTTGVGGHTCGLTMSGAAYCWGGNHIGQLGDGSTTLSSIPVAVSGGLSFSGLAAGAAHTCGLTRTGAANCWGNNEEGELGNGDIGPDTCNVANWRCSRSPVAVAGGLTFSALTLGGVHTCGLISGGAAYCWGDNSSGQLGDGTTTNSSIPVAVSWGLTSQ